MSLSLSWMGLSVAGTVRLDVPDETGQHEEPVRDSIITWLNDKRARTYTDENRIIRFEAGVSRLVTGLNILVPIRSGDIEVEAQRDEILIKYRFWYTEILILVTFGVFGLVGLFTFRAPNLSTLEAYGISLICWLLLIMPSVLYSRYGALAGLKGVAQAAMNTIALKPESS
jgi:hypothetical protein